PTRCTSRPMWCPRRWPKPVCCSVPWKTSIRSSGRGRRVPREGQGATGPPSTPVPPPTPVPPRGPTRHDAIGLLHPSTISPAMTTPKRAKTLRPGWTALGGLALGATVLAACSSSPAAHPSAQGPGTTTSSTTTAPPAPPTCPLTGQPVPGGGAVPARPALAVKVDNYPDARPQSGLDKADV